ncbi:MAG: GNAT family N-acetyltransferase [Sandaracinus sp.]|nr:GNAT family N-acetyltransferase [Sandaracinus sp.]|tara:strand:+ start:776 stop:1921 length:1146 start_codon:yes stop_codon:yes gene_type:complete
MTGVRVRFLESLTEVDPESWNALTGDDDPFVEHAFLSTLERSGSVGGDSGWEPMHVTLWTEEGTLEAALPLYLKDQSYGEYIFDWGWADAAHRAGIPYYPKLVSMVPFTPATGRRFLTAPEGDREALVGELLAGAQEAAERAGASSIHLNFLTDEEQQLANASGFLSRRTMQFHWHAAGDGSFEDFLGRFRSSMRKKTKKERRVVADAGLDIRVFSGDDLTPERWETMRRFYRDTCMRKGAIPYLTNGFFDQAADTLSDRAVIVMAFHEDEPVAASLAFEKGAHLYGRYWGCSDDYDMLHFELCYYQLIERAIAQGMTRFEAGAQGTHKLRRGLMPVPIHSAHWLRHPALAEAVAEFLPHEAMATERQIAALEEHGPFRRD